MRRAFEVEDDDVFPSGPPAGHRLSARPQADLHDTLVREAVHERACTIRFGGAVVHEGPCLLALQRTTRHHDPMSPTILLEGVDLGVRRGVEKSVDLEMSGRIVWRPAGRLRPAASSPWPRG